MKLNNKYLAIGLSVILLIVVLVFTTYYWKLTGNADSSASQFEVDSVVALELKNGEHASNVTNTGTTDLDVEVVEENHSIWRVTGNFILKLKETKQLPAKNKTIFVGRQR